MTTNAQDPFAVSMAGVTPPAKGDGAHKPHGHVSGAGQWAFNNRHSFGKDNPVAWYGLRNVAVNMVGIAGLMSTIVPVRMAMAHGAKWAEKKGMNFLSNELSRVYWQNAIGVGASFATFRTTYKTLQRSYDDVFVRPKSAEETSQAIHDLPKKLFQNFKQIGVVEYPVTMIGGFVLVGVRAGIAGVIPHAQTVQEKQFSSVLRNKNVQRDVFGCAFFAYPAFFEIIEHLGRGFQKNRGYDDAYHNEHINKDKQTLKETFTRQIPGVASGIIPYIFTNTWAHYNIGRQLSYNTIQRASPKATDHLIDNFAKAYRKEMPYQYFWMYTLGRDLYFDAYDKLTGKSKQPGTHAALPHHGPGSYASTQPTSTVAQVDAQGKAAEPKTAVAI